MSKASETVVFEYNESGLRVKKIATSTGTTHYTLHGKQITHLTNGNNTLHFFYDASGKPAMVEWNNGAETQKFAYIHNLQGDIVGIIDSLDNEVVKYSYDAWGKPLSTSGPLAASLGKLNPFRYRGYVFDEETGLYYLRSRYYDTNWRRFINADERIVNKFFSFNLFCYCGNDPINNTDADGNVFIKGAYAPSYNFYHNWVQDEIVRLNPDLSFEVFLGDTKRRADLVDLTNGIYEIKLDTEAHISHGLEQLQEYIAIDPEKYHLGKQILILPEPQSFSYPKTEVTVTVRQEGALILYDLKVRRKKPDLEKAKNTLKTLSYAALGALALYGAGKLLKKSFGSDPGILGGPAYGY